MNHHYAPPQYFSPSSFYYPYPVSPIHSLSSSDPSPPGSKLRIENGWYVQPASGQTGLSTLGTVSSIEPSLHRSSRPPSPTPSPPSVSRHDTKTHHYWRGRLAPLPGFSSPSDMLKLNHAVEIKKDHTERPLPPPPGLSQNNDVSVYVLPRVLIESISQGKSISTLDKYVCIIPPFWLHSAT